MADMTTTHAPRKTRTPVRMAKIRQHHAAGCLSFRLPGGQSRPCNGVGCQLRLYGRRSTAERTARRKAASSLRMWALVVFALTLLAFATTADQRGLTVVPAAATDIGSPSHWCAERKPHTGDTVTFSMRYDGYALADHVTAFRCAAAHPGGPAGTGHFYDVLVWDRNGDGVVERVEWIPLGPWWT